MYENGVYITGMIYDEEINEYIGGANYAFKVGGAMATGWFENKGGYSWDEEIGDWVYCPWAELYYFKNDGSWYDGWLKSGNVWYYLVDGYMLYDTVWYDGIAYDEWGSITDYGVPYYFDENGIMYTGGWITALIDEGCYDDETDMWVEYIQERCFYFQASGAGYTDCRVKIEDIDYMFDKKGYASVIEAA